MPATPAKASFPSAQDQAALLAKLREFALVGAGLAVNNRLDAFVRLRDLQDAGIINVSARFLAGGAGVGGAAGAGGSPPVIVEPAVDLTPPPVPGGFAATAGVTQILFETVAPVYRQGHGHARTKVYAAPASPLPTFADAVLYTDFPGNIGVAPFDPASNLRLWATWTSADGVESPPAGGTNGVAAATGLLEDVHIANLAVGKLLAGSLSVGQYIQSADYVAGVTGWRIQTLSGGGAFFECRGNAVFGGTIFAAAGTIGGATIGSNYVRSTNYILNTQGWNLNADGTGQIGGFQIASTYIQSTNYVAGTSGWRLTFDGQFLSKHFTVDAAGNATFSGALSAASGTFAGALSAATGTFAGALNAATGTFAGTLTAQVVETANIVGAAITTVTSATGAAPSVSVTVPAGSRSLTIIAEAGISSTLIDTDTVFAPNNGSIRKNVDGGGFTTIASGIGTVMATILDPAGGSYAFDIVATPPSGYGSATDATIVVLLTKR